MFGDRLDTHEDRPINLNSQEKTSLDKRAINALLVHAVRSKGAVAPKKD